MTAYAQHSLARQLVPSTAMPIIVPILLDPSYSSPAEIGAAQKQLG